MSTHWLLGRMNLYEVLPTNPKLVGRLIQSQSNEEMLQIATEAGMQTLLADGVRRAVRGETSLAEVLRVTDAGG